MGVICFQKYLVCIDLNIYCGEKVGCHDREGREMEIDSGKLE